LYLEFFGLREAPFNITPNPRYLYLTESHRTALEHLEYGVRQRKGFVALTGAVGTGKTTLCRALMEKLGDGFSTALILNPTLSEAQFLRSMLQEFGVLDIKGDKLRLRDRLNEFLLNETASGRDAVLIVDEAQHMSLDALEQVRLLSNLETDRQKLLQIVLAGQPELAKKLADPRLRQLSQRVMVRYHLSALGSQDTSRYIAHRLRMAGSEGRPEFERSAVGRIHERSRGIPRLVNAISDLSMLAAYSEKTDRVLDAHVDRAMSELKGIET
jgi:general secretion pathway protein A